jgi:hypothetical protein
MQPAARRASQPVAPRAPASEQGFTTIDLSGDQVDQNDKTTHRPLHTSLAIRAATALASARDAARWATGRVDLSALTALGQRASSSTQTAPAALPTSTPPSVSGVLQGHAPTAAQVASASAMRDHAYRLKQVAIPMAITAGAVAVGGEAFAGFTKILPKGDSNSDAFKAIGEIVGFSVFEAGVLVTVLGGCALHCNANIFGLVNPSEDAETLRNRALVRPLATAEGAAASRETAELLLDLTQHAGEPEAAAFKQDLLKGLSDKQFVEALVHLAAGPVGQKLDEAIDTLTQQVRYGDKDANPARAQINALRPQIAAAELQAPSTNRSALLVRNSDLVAAMLEHNFTGTLNARNLGGLRDPATSGEAQHSLLPRLKASNGSDAMQPTAHVINQLVALTHDRAEQELLKTTLLGAMNNKEFLQAFVNWASACGPTPCDDAAVSHAAKVVAQNPAVGKMLDQLLGLNLLGEHPESTSTDAPTAMQHLVEARMGELRRQAYTQARAIQVAKAKLQNEEINLAQLQDAALTLEIHGTAETAGASAW